MSPLSCQDVLEHIELHTAGETDPALAADLDRHLSACPSCRRAHEEAVELVALLDWEHRADAGLARLEERLLDRPGVLPFRRPQRPVWRRLAAVAALLLALLGLGVWLPTAGPGKGAPVEVTLLSGRDIPQERAAPPDRAAALARGEAAGLKSRLESDGATPSAYRARRREQAALGKTPAALPVDLALGLSNDGPRPLLLDLADPATTLQLELRGPGVVRVPASGSARPLADLGRVRLP